jgi:SAM-dependent methyltransferase
MKLQDITDIETLEDLLIYSELPTNNQTQALIQIFNNIASIPVEDILDIGCGYGRHSKSLAEQGYRVTGIDISQKAIEIAKTKSSGPIYLVGDIRTFESNIYFDAAYAHNSTMAYFTDENDFNSALSNVYFLVKHGGLFVFDLFYPTNLLKQNKYKRRLHQTKRVDDLTLDKYSEHKIDVQNQIHEEKSTYVVSDETDSKIFHTTETLKYYEPEQITDILKNEGFLDVLIFDRDIYTPLINSSIGICIVAKK